MALNFVQRAYIICIHLFSYYHLVLRVPLFFSSVFILKYPQFISLSTDLTASRESIREPLRENGGPYQLADPLV